MVGSGDPLGLRPPKRLRTVKAGDRLTTCGSRTTLAEGEVAFFAMLWSVVRW
jgi:hypothetical protein